MLRGEIGVRRQPVRSRGSRPRARRLVVRPSNLANSWLGGSRDRRLSGGLTGALGYLGIVVNCTGEPFPNETLDAPQARRYETVETAEASRRSITSGVNLFIKRTFLLLEYGWHADCPSPLEAEKRSVTRITRLMRGRLPRRASTRIRVCQSGYGGWRVTCGCLLRLLMTSCPPASR